MTCPRTFKRLAAIAALVAIVFTIIGNTAVKANEPYMQDYEVFDLIVKANKAGLVDKYSSLSEFNPGGEATADYCKDLLKKAAKLNGLKTKKIAGKEASLDWIGKNATKMLKGTSRPEWMEDPELWTECLSNLEKEVYQLYGSYRQGNKLSRIEVLAFVIDIFFPDITVGWDYSDEAIAYMLGSQTPTTP